MIKIIFSILLCSILMACAAAAPPFTPSPTSGQIPAKPTLPPLSSTLNPIPGQAKLQPQLAEKARADPQARFEVVVQFFVEPSSAEKSQLEKLVQVTGYSFGPVNLAEGTISGTDLEKLLALPFVKWIEERIPADVGQ